MRNKNKVLIIILALLLGYAFLQILPYKGYSGTSNFRIAKDEAPMVIAHGGAKHLYPENTIMAFEESFKMGVDVLEMDLCLTEDGVLVTHHDLTVDATSNATGEVNDFTYDELSKLNFGYNFEDLEGDKPYRSETDLNILNKLIPMTLDEMFETFTNETLYVMEIKDSGANGVKAADELNRLINKYDLQEYVCVASFDSEVMEHFNSIKDKKVNISMAFDNAAEFIILNYLGIGMFNTYNEAGIQIPTSEYGIGLDNSYLAYKTHHNNMFLHYWTINDKETMKHLIEIGCDGIITDRPDLMFEVLEEMNY